MNDPTNIPKSKSIIRNAIRTVVVETRAKSARTTTRVIVVGKGKR